MTKKQRFLSALRLEPPDMVPVSPLIHHRYAHAHLGRDDWRAVFECHQEIGSCHFRGPIGIGYAAEPVDGYEYTTETIAHGPRRRTTKTTFHTPRKVLTSVTDVGSIPHDPLVAKTTEYFLKEPEDWRIYIDYWGKLLEAARPTTSETVEQAVRVMGEDGVPSVALGSAFTSLGAVRGMQALLYDMIDIPDLLREAHSLACQLQELTIRSFLQSPAEVGFYDICWATGMNLGPDRFAEWLGDEVARMCDLVRSMPGKFITLYTLGRMRKIMPILADAAPHMIATFEPNEGDLSLAEAKQLYGDRLCIMGNFDCVILARGNRRDAREETRRCIEEAAEGGGYILGTGDEVPADTKPDNLQAMVDAARDYGAY